MSEPANVNTRTTIPQWALERAGKINALLPALDGNAVGYIAAQLALAELDGFKRGVLEAVATVERTFAEAKGKIR